MQGFNMGRYRPYDADPRKQSFNGRTGTHALGKRGRHEADEGLLTVRFELPFNVWCDACEAHIGQGVRYNAEKRQVGRYYSTPIFAFRCKKTCCQTWMEIQTDPKRARYVITTGAREQTKTWDPEDLGGHPIHDDGTGARVGEEANEEVDAFANVEKAFVDKQKAKARQSRLEELQDAATARSADPYTLNVKLRNTFRQEKKQRLRIEAQEDDLRRRIGWNSDKALLPLLENDESDQSAANVASEWTQGRDRAAGVGGDRIATPFRSQRNAQKNSSSSSARQPKTSVPPAANALAARLVANTRKKIDPFRIN